MPTFKRKLAAILHADVKGYSRLMDEDEEQTLCTLKNYLEVMRNLIQAHNGSVIGTEGDAILAEFKSVVEVVYCAVEIQKILKEKNSKLSTDQKLEFRIGINLGDIIEDNDDIFGSSVNVTARIQGLAEAGGICLSGSAYEQIENKTPFNFEYCGEYEVKNIEKPVPVWAMTAKTEEKKMDHQAEILAILKNMEGIPNEIKGINKSFSTLDKSVALMGQKIKTVEKVQIECKGNRIKKEDEFDERLDMLTTNGATAKAERSSFARLREKVAYVVCLLIYALIIYVATNGGV